MENEEEKYADMSGFLKMADEDPDGVLEVTSTLLKIDKSFESHESIKSQRFIAYSSKAISAIKSNNNKINDEIIDLIEKSLIEAKAADDASEDKQNDYYGLDRLIFLVKILEEVKPGRIQELWGKTKLDYFVDRVTMHEAVELSEEEIFEVFGNIFFTFPHIVKHAAIMNPSSSECITVYLSGKEPEDLKGWIRIFGDGTVKIDEVVNFDESKNPIEQDSITEDSMTESKDNNLGKEVENGLEDEWINKGKSYAQSEKYEDSLKCFDKVLELNSENVDGYIGKGYTLDKIGEKEKGMECFKKALQLRQSLNQQEGSHDQNIRNILARYHEDISRVAKDKGLFDRALKELETALEYRPSNDIRIFLTNMYATYIIIKLDVKNRGGGTDLSDDEYNELQKSLKMYDQVITMYEELNEDYVLKSDLPLKSAYDQAKTNIIAFGFFGSLKKDKNGQMIQRSSKKEWEEKKKLMRLKPTEEEIREQRQTLESEIKDLKQDRSKKYSEAGVIAYAKYKNNEPNFTGVTDIRIKWYAILAIDSEINKINQEIEALNSREKKSGFFAQIGDLISKTAKQGKSKIDLYTIGNKKNNAITEFGEQLYIDRNNGTLTLEELSNIWQKVDEFKKEIEIKEKEISALNK